MRRGTTPKFIFTLPFSTDRVVNAKVVFKQGDAVTVEKNITDCEMDGDTIAVRLTQEETLKFACKVNSRVQLRVLTFAGDALSSDVYIVSVDECLDDEVLE